MNQLVMLGTFSFTQPLTQLVLILYFKKRKGGCSRLNSANSHNVIDEDHVTIKSPIILAEKKAISEGIALEANEEPDAVARIQVAS
jgi:hypothetical protein